MGWLSNLIDILTGRGKPPAPVPVPTPPPTPAPFTPDALFAALNVARLANGLSPFIRDPKLDSIADLWARTIAGEGELTHGNFAARIEDAYPNTSASEDIADGYNSANAVVQGWMASPGHRINILGYFNHCGCGVAKSANGDLYVVADFDQHA